MRCEQGVNQLFHTPKLTLGTVSVHRDLQCKALFSVQKSFQPEKRSDKRLCRPWEKN